MKFMPSSALHNTRVELRIRSWHPDVANRAPMALRGETEANGCWRTHPLASRKHGAFDWGFNGHPSDVRSFPAEASAESRNTTEFM